MKFSVIAFLSCFIFSCNSARKAENSNEVNDHFCSYDNRSEETYPVYYYQIIYELSDTLNRRNLPLYGDSVLVTHLQDSIHPIRTDIQKIKFPEMWKEMQIQGASYYSLRVDEFGEIQAIESLRTIYQNDLILPQVERSLLGLKFIEEKYYEQVFILRILIRIDKKSN